MYYSEPVWPRKVPIVPTLTWMDSNWQAVVSAHLIPTLPPLSCWEELDTSTSRDSHDKPGAHTCLLPHTPPLQSALKHAPPHYPIRPFLPQGAANLYIAPLSHTFPPSPPRTSYVVVPLSLPPHPNRAHVLHRPTTAIYIYIYIPKKPTTRGRGTV